MEIKTAEATLKESMKHLEQFKRAWPSLDTETSKAVYSAFHIYAAQAVRLALEEAKYRAEVSLLNEYGCHEKDTNLFNSILSLEQSIIDKLK